MQVDVAATPGLAAQRAAQRLADALRAGIRRRGLACMALSGGRSPRPLFEALARQSLDWSAVHVFQVDERIAPAGDPARNLTALAEVFVHAGPLPAAQLHAMAVEQADPVAAAQGYAETLVTLAGEPVVLDAVHLGLGDDGHTASLFPGDAALAVTGRFVAVTDRHAGFRRLTLTYPVLDAARLVVWFVVGAGKQPVVRQLVAGDTAIPAGRVAGDRAVLVTDVADGKTPGR